MERLRLFERNKVPLGLKVLGLAMYFQISSLRRVARVLSEFCMVSKTAVWKWVVKLRDKLNIASERKVRGFIAVDETCVNVNGEQYWVYSALDLDRNELISMRVYPTRNFLTSESFFKGVLKYCEGKPEFIVDSAPWLKDALIELGLNYHHQTRGLRSLIESTFSSFKQRTKIFFNKITVNLKNNKALRWRRAVECWNLFCKTFTYYYNHLRG
ncbi:MAG: DDE-type integrase/transposase/recombinase [Candidatus Bathyarchaeia archaeon]